ncbi:MAG: hypothetical protein HQK81_01740 [Desulfovibrionaceae bacterium]|nr:hypothetical protein [Desulfovibrionaceae bacterium]MBF0512766.1 hypothetical protein [Desulfovibrionaceae bacterium]
MTSVNVPFLRTLSWFALAALAGLSLIASAQAGPSGQAGGFATHREGNVWWLTTDSGVRFYSRGVNTVNGGQDTAKARDGRAYYWPRYYPALDAWRAAALGRLTAWGFNTRGGWSDPDPSLALPITPELDLGRNAKLHWFDLFAPIRAAETREAAAALTAPYKDDPRVLGYFTDNEVGWWNAPLFAYYLADSWPGYTKKVLLDLLRDRYGGRFDKLLLDFVPGEGIASFTDLRRTGASLKLRPGGRGVKTIDAFLALCARRYYQLVHDALRASAPGKLILGDRLPLYYHQDAVLAMRGLVDAISTNYNVDDEDGWVAPYYFEGLEKLTGLPALITEFFFAANENRSGNANNGHLMHVATQRARAAGAAAAIENFAGFPNVVGAHWFQFADEPTGGRGDGEDFNMGLVDIDDRPYEELTEAFARVNPALEGVHAKAAFDKPDLAAVVRIPEAAGPIAAASETLAAWDKRATRLTGFSAPAPYVPFGDLHLCWRPEGLYFLNLASNYADLRLLDYTGEFPGSEAYQLHLFVEIEGRKRHFLARLIPEPHAKYPDRFQIRARFYDATGLDAGSDKGAGTGADHAEKGEVEPERLPDELIHALDKPLPHVAVQGFIPAALLGLDRLEPGQRLRFNAAATSFYRELTMVYAGNPKDGDAAAAFAGQGRTLVLAPGR